MCYYIAKFYNYICLTLYVTFLLTYKIQFYYVLLKKSFKSLIVKKTHDFKHQIIGFYPVIPGDERKKRNFILNVSLCGAHPHHGVKTLYPLSSLYLLDHVFLIFRVLDHCNWLLSYSIL